MKKIFTSCLALFVFKFSYTQLPAGFLAPIPDTLKKNAHSVTREEETVFEIRAIDKGSCRIHRMITVLDETDKDELDFEMHTDKFHLLDDVSVIIYNSTGEKIKNYNKKDLSVVTNIGEGLVSDGKVYYMQAPAVKSYPVHIQLDYEIKYNGLLHYPAYHVQVSGQSVEKSTFTAIVPADLDLRYKEKNIKLAPEITTDKGNKIYKWTVKNLPAIRYEPESVSFESRYPSVLLAPNRFSLDGNEGDMTSWEKFGEWYASLTKKTMNLAPERKLFFQELVKAAPTDKEKAAIIYRYLQQNCRYVLITLGIGGFKPFEASFVDSKKYGDCKALSNYVQACLDAVGIKSYQALINAEYNKEPVDPSFPCNTFNHDILCIPLQNDSVWLECTSNTNEFGVLGSFTENRNALLITENGGKLVSTPKSIAANNSFTTRTVVNLEEDGSGTAKVNIRPNGEYRKHFIATAKKDDQKIYIVNELGFIQPDDFSLTEKQKNGAELMIDLTLEKIPSFTAGTKMFLSPRIYKLWDKTLPDAANRKQDYYFYCPFIKEDSTIYHLPQGYTIDVLPEPKKVSFDYGKFNTSFSYDKDRNEVLSIAELELTNYHILSADFAKAKTFFDEVLAEYNTKIVIKKSAGN